MSKPLNQKKMGFIDGMRGFAAFYVVLQHCCTMMDPYFGFQRSGAQPSWLAMLMAPLWYGHLAVAAFIVISGFCLQWSLEEKSNGKLLDYLGFMKRRCRRILPPYYACLAFSLITCWLVTSRQTGMPWAIYLPVTTENVLAHVFMIQNLRPEWMYKINGVLWSISIEFQLYLMFAALAVGVNKLKNNYGLSMAVFSMFTIALGTVAPLGKLYLWFIPLFFVGMLAAKIAKRESKSGFAKHSLKLGILFLVLGVSGVFVVKEISIRDTFFGIGTAFMLLHGVLNPSATWTKLFEQRSIHFIGTFSYSLYLMHHLVLQWAFAYKPALISTPVRELGYLFIIGVPASLVVSYVFYLAFEKPFMAAKRVKSA